MNLYIIIHTHMNRHFLTIINELVSENDRLKAQIETLQKEAEERKTPLIKKSPIAHYAGFRMPSPGPCDEPTVVQPQVREETPSEDADTLSGSMTIEEEYKKLVDPTTGRCACGYKSRKSAKLGLTGYMVHRRRVKQHRDYLSSHIPKSS